MQNDSAKIRIEDPQTSGGEYLVSGMSYLVNRISPGKSAKKRVKTPKGAKKHEKITRNDKKSQFFYRWERRARREKSICRDNARITKCNTHLLGDHRDLCG